MKKKLTIITGAAPFNGKTVDKEGLGGSESSTIFLAEELVELDYEVKVFCNCPQPLTHRGVVYDDVKKIPNEDSCDILICSRYPESVLDIEAKTKVFLSHDMPALIERVSRVLWAFDLIVFLSEYQKSRWLEIFPTMERICTVIPNGYVQRYLPEEVVEKDQVLWGSCPERGLDYLLETIWPVLHDRHPMLKLILTGYGEWKEPQLAAFYEKCNKLIASAPNIEDKGSLAKEAYYRTLAESKCVVYPSRFPETCCLTAIESAAVGTPMVTTDNWGLPEVVSHGSLIKGEMGVGNYERDFLREVERALQGKSQTGPEYTYPMSWKTVASLLACKLKTVTKPKILQRISATILVKNEEDNIIRCVKSVRPYVDHIKLVDNGSSDRTMELIWESIDSVVQVEGDLSFAELRNKMIEGLGGDWILWIDGDEVLVGGKHLKRYVNNITCDAFRLKQVNLSIGQVQCGVETPIRLFKNMPDIKFKGFIHEQVEFPDVEIGPLPLIPDIFLAHLGYLTSDLVWEKMLKRNKRLFAKEKSAGIDRPILPLYEMRDLMNEVTRSLLIGGLKVEVDGLFKQIIEIWIREYEGKGNQVRKELAWELYQKALSCLGEQKKEWRDGEIPFKATVAVDISGKRKVIAAWFRHKEDFELRLEKVFEALREEELKNEERMWK